MKNILNYNSVENLPTVKARAVFQVNSASVFKEDIDILPVSISDNLKYMPWGGDNNMPYDILQLIEDDETLSTCQIFNAEVCYGSGLVYNCNDADNVTREQVQEFLMNNDLASYFLGACQDLKHFGFAVSVVILSNVWHIVVTNRACRAEGGVLLPFRPCRQVRQNSAGAVRELAQVRHGRETGGGD